MSQHAPAAILDVDGTLVAGSLGIAFTRYVFGDDYPYAGGIADAVQRYSDTGHQDDAAVSTYREMAAEIVYHWTQGTAGRRQEWLATQATQFLDQYTGTVAAAPDVLTTLADHCYDIYLVSITPDVVLKPFAARIAPADTRIAVFGTRVAVDADGRYTGQLDRNLVRDGKSSSLESIFTRSATTDSVAIGDHVTDIPLFEETEIPIAVSAELHDRAAEQGWHWYPDLAAVTTELDDLLP